MLIDVGPDGTLDSRHAHKPGIISRDDRLFHFYCAVAPATERQAGDIVRDEIRGIALAIS